MSNRRLPRKASSQKVMNLLIYEGYLPKPKNTPGSHIIFEKEGKRPIPVSASKYIPIGTLGIF
jgi:predicted RNA binding protein YcfA (HicA-like mRNA interferase family)